MIPKNAKKVFKGVLFDVYHWEQKIFDGRKKTFEKLTRQDNVTVIATVGKKIILIKQKQPAHKGWYLDLPGGRADKASESAMDCAKRELLEETGYSGSKMKLLKTFKREGHINYKTSLFLARDVKKIADQSLDGGEIIMPYLITYTQLMDSLLDEKFYIDPSIKLFLIRARLDKKFDAELKKIIFG